jgi:hypothetical protein
VPLASATPLLIVKRKKESGGRHPLPLDNVSFSYAAAIIGGKARHCCPSPNNNYASNNKDPSSFNLINLTKRIDQKILSNNWNKSA